MFSSMRFLLGVGLIVYAFDQATKWWIVLTMPFEDRREVIPGFFDLVHWGNTGAAFSFLRGNNSFFIGLSLVAFVVLLVLSARGAFRDRWTRWGAALLLGGILGNVTDRIAHGHVVDFLLFDLHVRFADPWPAFNIADSAIVIAVGLFLISSFQEEKARRRATVA